ncbi:MAG: hypothetical protein ACRC1K_26440, partial [Planctomycetia bacterium]
WCFSLEDNLFHPWKTSNAPNAIEAGDGPSFEYMAKEYREIHGGKDAPAAAEGAGSFSEWAYHHYGRWSLAGRGWWIPKTPGEDAAKKPEADKEPAKKADEKKEEGKDKKEDKAEDKRGDDALNALRWFAKEKIDGYAPWKEVELKDFPGRKVEVGGFKPFLRWNPPATQFQPLAEVHVKYLLKLGDWLPRLTIDDVQVESLGAGVHRLSLRVVNRGFLPTVSEMGQKTKAPHPLQYEWKLADGQKLLVGPPRGKLPKLDGNGGETRRSWLLAAPGDEPADVKVEVYSPSVGRVETTVRLTPKKEAGR